MFARMLFVLCLALAMQHQSLIRFRDHPAGHWAMRAAVLKEQPAPTPAFVERPIAVASAPAAIAGGERRDAARTNGAWLSGAIAIGLVALVQWLASSNSSAIELFVMLFELRR